MNQNTLTTTTTEPHYVAIDISKDSLQVHTSGGMTCRIAYDKAGLRQLLRSIRSACPPPSWSAKPRAVTSARYWALSTRQASP